MMCRADDWSSGPAFLDGDYDLDDPFGRELLKRLIRQKPEVAAVLRSWEPKAFVSQVPIVATAPRAGRRPRHPSPPLSGHGFAGQRAGFSAGAADAAQRTARMSALARKAR